MKLINFYLDSNEWETRLTVESGVNVLTIIIYGWWKCTKYLILCVWTRNVNNEFTYLIQIVALQSINSNYNFAIKNKSFYAIKLNFKIIIIIRALCASHSLSQFEWTFYFEEIKRWYKWNVGKLSVDQLGLI